MKHHKRIFITIGLTAWAIVAPNLIDGATGFGAPEPPPRAGAGGASLPTANKKPVELSFETLKKWVYVEGKTAIPDFIRKFDGQTVEMTGYMMPFDDIRNIKSFVLVPSLFGCCYGQPPAVNHVVLVKMTGETTAKFFEDTIRVRGTFHCGEEKEEGYLISLYRVDAQAVEAR